MRKIKKILIPFDFSEAAFKSIEYVQILAYDEGANGAKCIFLNVSNGHTEDKVILEKLNTGACSSLNARKIKTNSLVRNGEFTDTVHKVATEIQADLILIGTESKEARDTSHAADLIKKLDMPVLIVPNTDFPIKIEKILLAVDNNKIDDIQSLQTLNEIARWFGASIHLVLVSNDPLDKISGNSEILEYYLETIDFSTHSIVDSDIEEGIYTYVRDHNIDLLAIIPRTHSKKSISSGKLSEAMALNSKKPLLVLD